MTNQEIISKTIKIISPKLPPDVDFIEKEINNQGLEALRWAIIDIEENTITISASGRILNNVN